MFDSVHLAFYLLIALAAVVCLYVHRQGVELGAEECIKVLLDSGVIEQFTDEDGEIQLTPGGEEEDYNVNWTCQKCGFYGGCKSDREEEVEEVEENPSESEDL